MYKLNIYFQRWIIYLCSILAAICKPWRMYFFRWATFKKWNLNISWNSVHYFSLWSEHKSVNTTLDSTNRWLQKVWLESTIGWIQGGVNSEVSTPGAKIMHGIPARETGRLWLVSEENKRHEMLSSTPWKTSVWILQLKFPKYLFLWKIPHETH